VRRVTAIVCVAVWLVCCGETVQAGPVEEIAAGFACLSGIPDGLVSVAWLASDDYFHGGEYERAYCVLRLITRLDPADPEAWSTAAWLLINGIAPKHEGKKRQELVRAGISLLEEGISRTPGRWELLFDLGWENLQQDRPEEALGLLIKAAEMDAPLKVHRLKAEVLMRLGKSREAVEVFRRMWELFPSYRQTAERFIRKLSDGSRTDSSAHGETP